MWIKYQPGAFPLPMVGQWQVCFRQDPSCIGCLIMESIIITKWRNTTNQLKHKSYYPVRNFVWYEPFVCKSSILRYRLFFTCPHKKSTKYQCLYACLFRKLKISTFSLVKCKIWILKFKLISWSNWWSLLAHCAYWWHDWFWGRAIDRAL